MELKLMSFYTHFTIKIFYFMIILILHLTIFISQFVFSFVILICFAQMLPYFSLFSILGFAVQLFISF